MIWLCSYTLGLSCSLHRKKFKLLPKDSSTAKDVTIASESDVIKGSPKPITEHHVPPLLSELENLESLSIREKNMEQFPKPRPTTSDDDSTSDEDFLDEGSEQGEGEEGEGEEDQKAKEAAATTKFLTPGGARGSAGNAGSGSAVKKVPFPEVSQVSKLLSAISTWVSVPRDRGVESQQEHRSCDTTLKSHDRGSIGSASEDRSHDHQDQTRTHDRGRGSHDQEDRSCDQNGAVRIHEDLSRLSEKDNKTCDSAQDSKEASHDSSRTSHDPNKASNSDSNKASHGKAKPRSKSSKHSAAEEGVEEGEPEGVFLPPVHSINVGGIQRSLFNSQLRQHLSGVCPILGLSFYHVLPLVNNTTQNFR